MKPLPRVLAFIDADVAALTDLGVRAAAVAAAGPAVALVARQPGGTADQLAMLALRLRALATPPMAGLLVSGRSDIALAAAADGVVLREGDLDVATVRHLAPALRIFRSIHSESEAETAAGAGADALIAGNIWPTPSHPARTAAGIDFLSRVAALGVPTYAIGGVTVARAREACDAGAFGVAAIRALWNAPRTYDATRELIAACN
jgi:thiamine-phosphate diphosphorylase